MPPGHLRVSGTAPRVRVCMYLHTVDYDYSIYMYVPAPTILVYVCTHGLALAPSNVTRVCTAYSIALCSWACWPKICLQ